MTADIYSHISLPSEKAMLPVLEDDTILDDLSPEEDKKLAGALDTALKQIEIK